MNILCCLLWPHSVGGVTFFISNYKKAYVIIVHQKNDYHAICSTRYKYLPGHCRPIIMDPIQRIRVCRNRPAPNLPSLFFGMYWREIEMWSLDCSWVQKRPPARIGTPPFVFWTNDLDPVLEVPRRFLFSNPNHPTVRASVLGPPGEIQTLLVVSAFVRFISDAGPHAGILIKIIKYWIGARGCLPEYYEKLFYYHILRY